MKSIGPLALLALAAAFELASPARADSAADAARLDKLQQDIQNLEAQVQDLKRGAADQYADMRSEQASAVKLSLANGRPTLSTADGDFTFSLRSLVQFDSAYYGQGRLPAGTDFASGSDFRRARFGFEGTAFRDWSYQFIYDFGGSGVESPTISSAYVQFNGLAPVYVKAGAYPPPENFDDATSAADLLFLERAQPADLARGIAAADGRDAATVYGFDDNVFAALSLTGGAVGDAANFDEQLALVGRAAWRLYASADANIAVGADTTYVLQFPDLTAGSGSAHAFRLRERPELNVDSNGVRLIDTGAIDADHGWEWGLETAGNYRNFYGQGGYFGFKAFRRASALADPDFAGWYAEASWVLTGETRTYRPDLGAYAAPKPKDAFSLDHAGLGAWELAARYSVLDLNFDPGVAGAAAPADGIRGGRQRIWSAGINWYPNSLLRLMLDYQHTDVSRLSGAGGDLGARLDDVSLRLQLSL